MTTKLGTAASPSRHHSDTPMALRQARLVPLSAPSAAPRPRPDGPRPCVDGKFLASRAGAASIERRVRAGVDACAGHPAVLAYAVGNEIPASVVRWHGR